MEVFFILILMLNHENGMEMNQNRWLILVATRFMIILKVKKRDLSVLCQYQAHLKNGDWLHLIQKVDDTALGYAGIYGKEIDALKLKK